MLYAFRNPFCARSNPARPEDLRIALITADENRQLLSRFPGIINAQAGFAREDYGPLADAIEVVKEQISADVAGQYGMTHSGNKADVQAGSDRATTRYIEVADSAIQAWRAQNGRDPLDGEVTKIVRDAITDYRKKNPELDKQLYPGGKAGGPSLRPKAKPPEKGPAPALYQINQLDDIPNRAVVLRQYRELPVLQLQSILKMMDLADGGKALPVKFERAWRDAGAQSAWDFINTQLRMYPNYSNDRSPQEMEKIRRRLQAAAASVNAYVASRAVSETMPYLAGLGDWSMRVGMGA